MTQLISDQRITELCTAHTPMIEPFERTSIKTTPTGDKCLSYGLSSYGYDIRLGNRFKVFTNMHPEPIDPKNFSDQSLQDIHTYDHESIAIPPNSFALAVSKEHFNIPANVLAICLGKSTYARAGLIVNVTPLEPAWCGHLTIELSNTTPNHLLVYAGEGIAQLLFFENEPCLSSYVDRSGKYQGQEGITYAK